MNRRDFLKSGAVAAASLQAQGTAGGVALVVDPEDKVLQEPPVAWALEKLKAALTDKHVRVTTVARPGSASAAAMVVVPRVKSGAPESVSIRSASVDGRQMVLAEGGDAAGVKYALLELADRVRYAPDALAALRIERAIEERPANRIRSIMRCFVSDVEDKSWYNDKAMWPAYLDMLAAQRFNRFNLAFGIGYDFLREITDCYFHFAYPFLIQPPGWEHVRVRGLPDAERDRNLQMLTYISNEADARGIHFQLGLWTHGYQWANSPHANYVIEGLKPEDHAQYCCDALLFILDECPGIRGLTLRIHGESGVAEGDYPFWEKLFQGVTSKGGPIELDMHAKGLDFEMIQVGLKTELPVVVSPKYWAEHMGLGYHQAGIRELEMPPRGRQDEGFFARSNGSRKFLRYGYGDLLREDRKYGVLHRIWPGTQRILLSGDPALAAAYGRASSFCGSDGIEICEPLSFKGRKGSGHPGGRCAYADASLKPHWDWQKFEYGYRVWGRNLYNPDCDPQVWRRYSNRQFGAAAPAAEVSLANASRILPLITTAHGASAANNSYWPEIYTNMPIVEGRSSPYSDTPVPKKFGTVSPFDPELFSGVDEFASELLAGKRSGKLSPGDVACWLEQFSEAATAVSMGGTPESRRWNIDVLIQGGLGRFFAAKFRSGALYAIYEKTGDREALELALRHYREAREAWAKMASSAKGVYMADISAGRENLHGHWIDRLPAIDEDIAAMAKVLGTVGAKLAGGEESHATADAIRAALSGSAAAPAQARHVPPRNFRPGDAIALSIAAKGAESIELRYRLVNQSLRFTPVAMQLRDGQHHANIPGAYTRSPYPLQYYFVVRRNAADVSLYPGLQPPAWSQPYFVVRQQA